MERRLIVALVAYQRFKLARFPAFLHRIVAGVDSHGVAMQMRIGQRYPVLGDGTRGAVNELGPDHVAGGPVFVAALGAHPHLHLVFHLLHRFLDRIAERGLNALVLAHLVGKRHRLGSVEREVIGDPPVGLGARRERLAGPRVEVIAQPEIALFVHLAGQAKHLRTAPVPLSRELRGVPKIIIPVHVPGEIVLGLLSVNGRSDGQHRLTSNALVDLRQYKIW